MSLFSAARAAENRDKSVKFGITGDTIALAAVIAFFGLNGRRLTLTNDEACNLVMNVAAGQLDAADAIAAVLQRAIQPRRYGGTHDR